MTLTDTSGVEPRSIRHLLRTSTAALHARVDAEIGGLLQHPTAGYAQFLTATARGLFPIERALDEADVAAILPDWPQRCRAEALKSDLAALSVACPADEDTVALPPGDEAYLFGVLYVLEGSRLGGGVILRQLQNGDLSIHRQATRYLSHGQGLALWPSFLRHLDASRATARDPHRAIAGALAAFQTFLPPGRENCCAEH